MIPKPKNAISKQLKAVLYPVVLSLLVSAVSIGSGVYIYNEATFPAQNRDFSLNGLGPLFTLFWGILSFPVPSVLAYYVYCRLRRMKFQYSILLIFSALLVSEVLTVAAIFVYFPHTIIIPLCVVSLPAPYLATIGYYSGRQPPRD